MSSQGRRGRWPLAWYKGRNRTERTYESANRPVMPSSGRRDQDEEAFSSDEVHDSLNGLSAALPVWTG